jgi:outer membrane PBP1 activator LpoA protein
VKSIWMNRRIHAGLFAVWTSVLLIGCGKKGASQNEKAVQPQAAASAPVDGGDTSPPPVATYDEQVTQRAIDFLKARVARKEWDTARDALKQLEKRPLTPQQQQEVDRLKALVPPR